jgi:dihydrofolate reductase
MIALVAAMAANRAIGKDGELPWHLPADLRFFKRLTTGHTVIMGRKTFDTVGRPLPDRWNVIVTRDRNYRQAGASVVHSIEEALRMTRGDEISFVVGGAEIYRLALPYAHRLYLTVVHATPDGDTFFPEFDEREWELVEDVLHDADEQHAYAFSFRRYDRRTQEARAV